MAKRYLKTIVSRLKTSSPKIQVNPSSESSTAEPLIHTFAFFNVASVADLVLMLPHFVALGVLAVFTLLDDSAFLKARKKITKLI